MGISWVTFDSGSKTSTGSSRIFVGVANMGADNVFISEDAGATWSAIAGQNNTFMPHHGMLFNTHLRYLRTSVLTTPIHFIQVYYRLPRMHYTSLIAMALVLMMARLVMS